MSSLPSASATFPALSPPPNLHMYDKACVWHRSTVGFWKLECEKGAHRWLDPKVLWEKGQYSSCQRNSPGNFPKAPVTLIECCCFVIVPWGPATCVYPSYTRAFRTQQYSCAKHKLNHTCASGVLSVGNVVDAAGKEDSQKHGHLP